MQENFGKERERERERERVYLSKTFSKKYQHYFDRKRTLEEMKSFLFKTLHLWTVAYVSLLTISYSDFLDRQRWI